MGKHIDLIVGLPLIGILWWISCVVLALPIYKTRRSSITSAFEMNQFTWSIDLEFLLSLHCSVIGLIGWIIFYLIIWYVRYYKH